ncbi:Cleft lip and palate associated transmembrane protein 1, partial [Spiromyces aspiralis]
NPLCTRRDDYYPLTNKTDGEGVDSALEAKSFPLRIQFNAVKLGWLRLSNQLNYVFKQFASPGSAIKFSEKELDGLRHTFFEVNPTLVFVTVMASLLHILFEFLAYKEDIAFWASGGKREDKDGGSGDAFEGISRTFVWMSLIGSWCSVFYVWDQKSDTSVIVLGGAVVRAVVETWKIKKLLMLPKGGDAVVDTSSNGKEALPAERGE